ncbi:MAG: hypothetical protein KatS3mg096_226 [Candidatus Parcubacteria bacterium]|nr:MAG: hypothetical protein KatS3mg096_226 [Candidatus Parcubacteria bacterium]
MYQLIKKHLVFWLIPVFLLFFWYFKSIIFPFLVGIILGSAIQSLAFFLNYKIKINYHLAVFLIYLGFIFLFIFAFYLTIKVLLTEIPSLLEKLQPYISFIRNLNIKVQWADFFSFTDYLPNALQFLSKFMGGFISLGLIFVVSIYVSLSKNFPETLLFSLKVKEDYFKLWRMIRRKISFWFLGQIILMVFIGLGTYIFTGLILKVKYASLISLVAGLLEIIPILGPIMTLTIASLIIFLENPGYVLPTIIFFIFLQQIESHFLVPLVMKKAIALNPLLVILGILIGAKIGGILGIIIMLPLLSVIVEIINLKTKIGEA